MATIQFTPPTGGASADAMDMMTGFAHVMIALQAIQKTLPEPQASSVDLAFQELGKVLATMMDRHGIQASIDPAEEGKP